MNPFGQMRTAGRHSVNMKSFHSLRNLSGSATNSGDSQDRGNGDRNNVLKTNYQDLSVLAITIGSGKPTAIRTGKRSP